jgi:hypothetical protein
MPAQLMPTKISFNCFNGGFTPINVSQPSGLFLVSRDTLAIGYKKLWTNLEIDQTLKCRNNFSLRDISNNSLRFEVNNNKTISNNELDVFNNINCEAITILNNYKTVTLNLENFGTSTKKFIRICPRISQGTFRGTFYCSRTGSGNSTSMNGKICAMFGQGLQFNCSFDFQRTKASSLLTCSLGRTASFLYLIIDANSNHMPRFITFYAETNGHDIIGESNVGTVIVPPEVFDTTTTIFGTLSSGPIISSSDFSSTGSNQVSMFSKQKTINSTFYAVGETVLVNHTSRVDRNQTVQVRLNGNTEFSIGGSGSILSGTWRTKGTVPHINPSTLLTNYSIMCQRVE